MKSESDNMLITVPLLKNLYRGGVVVFVALFNCGAGAVIGV